MLIPALLVLLSTVPPIGATTYQLQINLYRGADTVTAMLHIGEGLVGNVMVEQHRSFTRIRTSVRKSPKEGCLLVNVGYAAAASQESVDKLTIEPLPTMQLCGVATGLASVDNEVSYRVTVRELPASPPSTDSTAVRQ